MGSNFARELNFMLKAHIFNPFWHSRDRRRVKRSLESYKRAASVFDKYRDFIRNIDLTPEPDSDGTSDEKIFSIWFQGRENAPKLVKICFNRLEALYANRYVVLDNESLKDWIKLPEHIIKKWEDGTIAPAHFSDICRIELLYRYGGMWFDATDFITEPVPRWIENSDLFIYTAGDRITPHALIQSCFMRARKGNPLMRAWREAIFEYWRHEDKRIDYFLLHYMLRYLVENNEGAATIFYAMPQIPQDPTHLLWHANADTPYSDTLYLESTKDVFFQKTNFKSKSASRPVPGSVADFILNDKIKIPYGETRLSDSRP